MNEEKRMPMVLESVGGLVDEIVVVDSGSTDRTEEIARAYGARFLRHDWVSVGHQVKWAEEQCSHRWVMRLDADEVVPPEMAEEIMEIRRNGTKDAYTFRIGEMFPGMKRPNRWVKHYKLIRLYDRDAYSMSGRHGHDDVEKVRDDATSEPLGCMIHHYSYLSLHHLIAKGNTETDRLAERAALEQKGYSPWRMVGAMSLSFFKHYILGRFFLLGWWGFIHSVNLDFMRFMKFAKYYELSCLAETEYPSR
jgi:glycosyltransferase involved in cell wall biosynthesis